MTNTQHPYADILRAIADGEVIQADSSNSESKWEDIHWTTALSHVYSNISTARIRIKPKTININGIEVPEPVRVALKKYQEYWHPILSNNSKDAYAAAWDNDEIGNYRLNMGVIHLTKEAAEIHAKALLSFTKVKD